VISVDEARGYYRGSDAAHDFDHVLRVLALARRIGEVEGADMEVVEAAVLLHDIARAEEERTGICHAMEGARRARHILRGHAPEKVEAVAQAIAAHRFRRGPEPRSLEAKVLYDADKLDAIGAIGIARAYAVAGRERQRLWAPMEALAGGEHTPVHEFAFKLSRLKDGLYTETGRRLAQARHRYMVEFFRRLELEVKGEL